MSSLRHRGCSSFWPASGVTLLEFLSSVLLLVLFVAFYVEWNSFRAAERMRSDLQAQIAELSSAAWRYRDAELPFVRGNTLAQLNNGWPDSLDSLKRTVLQDVSSAIPGGRWTVSREKKWGQVKVEGHSTGEPPPFNDVQGLKLRLEVPSHSLYARLLQEVGGTEEWSSSAEAWPNNPWRRVLLEEHASCEIDSPCDALEIMLAPSPPKYWVPQVPVDTDLVIDIADLRAKIVAANYDLGSARFTNLERVIVDSTLRTNILEAGQVMRCCTLGDPEVPEGSTKLPERAARTGSKVQVKDDTRRIAHTGMGYLGLGDAFVGSDALYTRVLKLGGSAWTHVQPPTNTRHAEDNSRSESSYFSWVELKNVVISKGAQNFNTESCSGEFTGYLIGWRPGDLDGATSYKTFKSRLRFTRDRWHTLVDPREGVSIENTRARFDPATTDLCRGRNLRSSDAEEEDVLIKTDVNSDLITIIKHFFHPETVYDKRGDNAFRDDDGYLKGKSDHFFVPVWGNQFSRPDESSPGSPIHTQGLMGGLQRRSDARIKERIRPLALNADALTGIRAYSYDKSGRQQMGFVAQEVQRYYPRLVRQGTDGYMRLRYEGMIPVLWGQLSGLVEDSTAQWSSLEQKLEQLEARHGISRQ